MGTLISFTRTLIETEVKRMLREKTAGGRFAATDYNRWVDLACLDVCKRTRAIRGVSSISSVAGTQAYATYPKALGSWAITRVDYAGKKLKGPHPWDRAEEKVPEGMSLSSAGVPVYWFLFGTDVYLFPVPVSSNDTIKFWAAEQPYSMSADGVTLTMIGMEEWMHDAVELFMAYKGSLLSGDPAKAQMFYQLYLQALGETLNTGMPDVAEEKAREPG